MHRGRKIIADARYCTYCGGLRYGSQKQLCQSCYDMGVQVKMLRAFIAKDGTLHCVTCNTLLNDPALFNPDGRFRGLDFLCLACQEGVPVVSPRITTPLSITEEIVISEPVPEVLELPPLLTEPVIMQTQDMENGAPAASIEPAIKPNPIYTGNVRPLSTLERLIQFAPQPVQQAFIRLALRRAQQS